MSKKVDSNVAFHGEKLQERISQAKIHIPKINLLSDYLTMQLTGLGFEGISNYEKRHQGGLSAIFGDVLEQLDPSLTHHDIDISYMQIFDDEFVFEIPPSFSTHIGALEKSSLMASELYECLTKGTLKERNATLQTKDVNQQIANEVKTKRPLIIGAGGIGTYTALLLSDEPIESLTCIDFDDVEGQNLNRQLLYKNAIGTKKVKTLVSQIKKIAPHIDYSPLDMKVTSFDELDDIQKQSEFDSVFCCTDNVKSRKLLSKYCEQKQIPLYEAGCGTSEFNAYAQIPGESKPLYQIRNFDEEIESEERVENEEIEKKKTSCIYKPNPSIVMPNALSAVCQVTQARTRDFNNKYSILGSTKTTRTYDIF